MSSIHPHFTIKYSQPEEYHFSHDSVFLARQVFELERESLGSDVEIMDLCSGCGVVGLDFLFYCRNELAIEPRAVHFYDVQNIYDSHFQVNRSHFMSSTTDIQFYCKNYEEILDGSYERTRYDLILCNPPYFFKGQGKLSPSEFKNRCRFFIDSDFASLLLAIEKSLKPCGRAYMLLRSLSDHQIDQIKFAKEVLSGRAEIKKVGTVRGTDLMKITIK